MNIENSPIANFGQAASVLLQSMLDELKREDRTSADALAKALARGSWLTLETSVSMAGLSECKLMVCAPSGERVQIVEVGYEIQH